MAARLVLRRRRKFYPISADIRDHLHWLPIRLLVYKCLHGIAPLYLVEMLQSQSDVLTFQISDAYARLPVVTQLRRLDQEASLFLAPYSGTRYLITSGITHCLFISWKKTLHVFIPSTPVTLIHRVAFTFVVCWSVFVTAFAVRERYINRFYITLCWNSLLIFQHNLRIFYSTFGYFILLTIWIVNSR